MGEWEQFLEEIYDYIMNLKDDKGRPRRAGRGKTAIIGFAAARKSLINISIDLITQTQRKEEQQPYCKAFQVSPPQNSDEEQHFAVQHWKLHILHICNSFKTLLDVNSLIIFFFNIKSSAFTEALFDRICLIKHVQGRLQWVLAVMQRGCH